MSFTGLAVVAAAALAAPLALGLFPRIRLPSIVLEILLGIVIGPHVLGWVSIDTPIEVMSLLGLAFLLFLAGLEVEYERFRGRLLGVTALGYAMSFGLALLIGLGLHAGGLVKSPLLVGIALSATSLGIVIPVLKDAGQISTPFGQLVAAGASIAEIATIILLSLFFSGESSGIGAKLVLLGLFGLFVLVVAFVVFGAEHSMRISAALVRLQDTTAQIRIRGAFLLLALFIVLAQRLGLEAILGAFLAGAILKLLDRDEMLTHPEFRQKLEAVGYGVFVPVFFVATGVQFDLSALFANATSLARVPIFLAALLIARGLPAIVYRSLPTPAQRLAAGLLQATSLSFLVVAGQIGVDLDLVRPVVYAALVAAGLMSVVLFPATALALLRSVEKQPRGVLRAAR
ncbi:MAG TPA: cation:proton antiporter [Gaiellaceae bacterium]|nr:cation:proton antiporter [Gaiellaceae bacterium]